MTAFRYVLGMYLAAAFGVLGAGTVVLSVIDFSDRAKFFRGDGWLGAVLELYGYKALIYAHEIAPAALVVAAAITISVLRRTSEATALGALGRGPAVFLGPIAAGAAGVGLIFVLIEDVAVAPARERAEEILAMRFNRWDNWNLYHQEKRWFRVDDRRLVSVDMRTATEWRGVTVLETAADGGLVRRLHAASARPSRELAWTLTDVETRRYRGTDTQLVEHEAAREETLGLDPRVFRLRTGRPSQLDRRELSTQILLREELGLPAGEWRANRFDRRIHIAACIPAALLAAATALRRSRRGHLTMAVTEGAIVVGISFLLSMAGRAIALGGLVPDLWAAVTVLAVTAGLAALVLRRQG